MSKFFHEKSQFNKKNALKTVFWSVLGIFRKNCKQIFSSLLTYLSTQRVIWIFQRPSKSVLTDWGHSKRNITVIKSYTSKYFDLLRIDLIQYSLLFVLNILISIQLQILFITFNYDRKKYNPHLQIY